MAVDPILTINIPSTVYQGVPFDVTGRLTDPDTGAGIGSKPVKLYVDEILAIETATSNNGSYTASVTIAAIGEHTIRVWFPGDAPAPEDITVTDTIIGTRLTTHGSVGDITSFDDLTAISFGKYHPLFITFVKDNGATNTISIPSTVQTTNPPPILLVSKTEMYVLWGGEAIGGPAPGGTGGSLAYTPIVMSRYSLIGDPPTSWQLIEEVNLSDTIGAGLLADRRSSFCILPSDVVQYTLGADYPTYGEGARPVRLIKLKSGAVVGMWAEHLGHALYYTDGVTHTVYPTHYLGLAYRSPSGVWSHLFPAYDCNTNMPYGIWDIAQHPEDDSIWAFAKIDSEDCVRACHMTETDGLVLDWIDSGRSPTQRICFLDTHPDGTYLLAPYGEIARFNVTADPYRNTLALSFAVYEWRGGQRNEWPGNPPAPSVPGVNTVCWNASGEKEFFYHEDWTYGMSPTLVMPMRDKFWIAYMRADHVTGDWKQLFINSYDFATGAWGMPRLLWGGWDNTLVSAAVRYNVRGNQVQLAINGADLNLHLVRLTDNDAPQELP